MQLFDWILLIKIVGTAAGMVIPVFVLPPRVSAPLLGLEVGQMRYMRLYGLAVAALLIGYASAFSWWRGDGFPYGIAIMGLVSNGGATAFLLTDRHLRLVRLGAPFFGVITVALAASLAFPEWAMQPLQGIAPTPLLVSRILRCSILVIVLAHGKSERSNRVHRRSSSDLDSGGGLFRQRDRRTHLGDPR